MVTYTGWARNEKGDKAVRLQFRRPDHDVNEEYEAMHRASAQYTRIYGEIPPSAGHNHKAES